jgi:FKBP-type peptidyl-prolyl cis-trans isomerase
MTADFHENEYLRPAIQENFYAMRMKFRNITAFLLLAFTVVLSSCLKDKTEERTLEQEESEIDLFIHDLIGQGIEIDTTELGVYYTIHTEGEGPLVKTGDTITISYALYKTNGVLIDSSEGMNEAGTWEFVYPGNFIAGFNNAISVMNKNCEAEFIIPSSLGYGPYGYLPTIGAYETLIFGIKIHEIKPVATE